MPFPLDEIRVKWIEKKRVVVLRKCESSNLKVWAEVGWMLNGKWGKGEGGLAVCRPNFKCLCESDSIKLAATNE